MMAGHVSASDSRKRPNVLITGTPGTGKSITAEEVAGKTGLNHIDVGEVARRYECYENWDAEYNCHVLDEDKVLDVLESTMSNGGNVVEYHGCDFFPKRWFDAVFVLRTDNTILYDRLEQRAYPTRKISENVQCEIFQTILDEARDAYAADIVHELGNNIPEDVEKNTRLIELFVEEWLGKRCTK